VWKFDFLPDVMPPIAMQNNWDILERDWSCPYSIFIYREMGIYVSPKDIEDEIIK